jgi:hypothetical protein
MNNQSQRYGPRCAVCLTGYRKRVSACRCPRLRDRRGSRAYPTSATEPNQTAYNLQHTFVCAGPRRRSFCQLGHCVQLRECPPYEPRARISGYEHLFESTGFFMQFPHTSQRAAVINVMRVLLGAYSTFRGLSCSEAPFSQARGSKCWALQQDARARKSKLYLFLDGAPISLTIIVLAIFSNNGLSLWNSSSGARNTA